MWGLGSRGKFAWCAGFCGLKFLEADANLSPSHQANTQTCALDARGTFEGVEDEVEVGGRCYWWPSSSIAACGGGVARDDVDVSSSSSSSPAFVCVVWSAMRSGDGEERRSGGELGSGLQKGTRVPASNVTCKSFFGDRVRKDGQTRKQY